MNANHIAKMNNIYCHVRKYLISHGGPAARPPAQQGQVGFTVLYTPFRHRPELLIVGQNPGNFGSNRNVWDDVPNRDMTRGAIPEVNSYLNHDHEFAQALRRHFAGCYSRLLEECVGMNLWYVQAVGTPDLQADLTAFFEETSRKVVRLVEPRVILCLSSRAFDALRTSSAAPLGDPAIGSKTAEVDGIPLIYAHHPTGRWSRRSAELSIPVALREIAARLEMTVSPPTAPAVGSSALSSPVARSVSGLSGGRRYQITPAGLSLAHQPGQVTQLKVILRLLAHGRGTDEAALAELMARNPLIQQSRQTPLALLNWYRTHHLLPKGLAQVQ